MKIREIYRQELALRGIRIKDIMEAEQWATKRAVVGAALMEIECPPHCIPMMRKLFSDLADELCAPIRERQ